MTKHSLTQAQVVAKLSQDQMCTMKLIEENGGHWQAEGYYLFEDGSKGCFSKKGLVRSKNVNHYLFEVIDDANSTQV